MNRVKFLNFCLRVKRTGFSQSREFSVAMCFGLIGILLPAMTSIAAEVSEPPAPPIEHDPGEGVRLWDAMELAPLLDPPGRLHSWHAGRTGTRLGAPRTELILPVSGVDKSALLSVKLYGWIRTTSPATRVRLSMSGGSGEYFSFVPGEFVFRYLIRGANPARKIFIEVPPALLGQETDDIADRGCFIVWASIRPLAVDAISKAGQDGLYLAVGGPSDEDFIRSGFREKETPGFRWTMKSFELEIPVLAEHSFRELSIFGRLPKEIENREVRLKIWNEEEPQPPMSVTFRIDETDFLERKVALPNPLGPGVYRFHFDLGGTWIPKNFGAGGDPRELGFYLTGVGLR